LPGIAGAGERVEVVRPRDPAESTGVPGGAEPTGVPDLAESAGVPDRVEAAGVAQAARDLELVAGNVAGILLARGILPPGAGGELPGPSAGPGIVRPRRARRPRTRERGTLGVPCPAIATPPCATHLCLPVQSLGAEPDVQPS
jgi:hypothetical protein